MKRYIVTIPIAGHITFEVEAGDEEAAKAVAWGMEADEGEIEWETLESFSTGNVCHCPSPWNLTAEEMR
jgi:hypothetical protein